MRFSNKDSRRVFTAIVLVVMSVLSVVVHAQSSRRVTEAMVDEWMTSLSNWGRWGSDDELGTLNLITLEKRRAALAHPP